ncbi:hypothetical protein CRYUN_Cryun03dG0020700 [Craigia yunnanensis]
MPTNWIELLLLAALALLSSCSAVKVEYDATAIIIDCQRKIINAGAIHYTHSTEQKAKDGGLGAVETYIFWDLHEPKRRKYDFSGNLNFIKFFQLIQNAGLYAVLRIGPYVCAEWNYGGSPMWLHNTPGIQLRTDNEIYKIENEYGNTISIPAMDFTYYDQFKPNNPKSPKMWTENWTGWNLYQPKYGHLKQLHAALKVGKKSLTSGQVTTKNYAKDVDLTTYVINDTGERFYFFSYQNGQNDANVDLGQDGKYFVPAWSVSILQNCNKEIFNSAKLTSQTSVMIKKLNYKDDNDVVDGIGEANEGDVDVPETEEKAPKLTWTWVPESMRDPSKERVDLERQFLTRKKQLLISVTTCGYQFSKQANGQQMVNGDDYSFVFEKPVSLNPWANTVSLLSATIGLVITPILKSVENRISYHCFNIGRTMVRSNDLKPCFMLGGWLSAVGQRCKKDY